MQNPVVNAAAELMRAAKDHDHFEVGRAYLALRAAYDCTAQATELDHLYLASYLCVNALSLEITGEFDGDESYVFEAARSLAVRLAPALYGDPEAATTPC